ncbi:MAG: RagB/SusD family nutrient uptake outer membrane protein [Chloroflexota bacterium]
MKKYIGIGLIAIGLLPLTSCEDFLDLKPVSQGVAVDNLSSDSIVYASGEEAEAALAGIYSEFRNEYWELDYFVNGDAQSDNSYAGADNPANFQIDEMRIDAINSNVSRDWGYLYSTIGKANEVINNVEDVTDLSAERKAQIKGEASFIRAFHYFQLVQLWGDVPLQLQEIKTVSVEILPEIYPIMFPARAPQSEVYAQIIADLELAASTAPVSAPNKGYVTKGAANAVLAKVYATMEPHDWNKVNEYCDKVISGPYSLLENYDDLWNNLAENTAESIFEINYEGTSSSGNWGVNMFQGTDWKKFNTPTNDLIAAFDAEGDQIRKEASIKFQDVSGKWTDPYWPANNFPFINKYRNLTSPSPQNYIILRLADIILLKAEALNETGDITGAAQLVDMIRSRVDLANTTADTQEGMRLAIEKERRLELAFEGQRWFDLKRTGRAIEVMSNLKGPDGESLNYPVNENRLWWPIPQSELDNNTKLVQNPGY